MDPLKDLKGAVKLADRFLRAATPLAELGNAHREHREAEEERERRERATGCKTCSGTGKVGKNTKIECPKCQGIVEGIFEPNCSVCDDSGKVGEPGHELPCPECT